MDILKVALSQYGITETKGVENNPEVMKYFHETNRKWVNADEVSWCDAFMDWCAMKAGLKISPGLLARGWLKEGKKVRPEDVSKLIVEIPILVVYWRGSIEGIYGHVGLVMRHTQYTDWTLGGNQGYLGQVNITPYPINGAKMGVLGYRRLAE